MAIASLRLLADDLTGALDCAARFVPVTGPLPVVWRSDPLPDCGAVDSCTREVPEQSAYAIVASLAPWLAAGGLAFKKIDSLLRGHVPAELAACAPAFDHCVLAPAFPFQGRITRGGRQLVRERQGWRDTGVDLPNELARHGIGVHLSDAATDADLDAVVRRGKSLPGRVLWCGTGGLAGALAGRRSVPRPHLPRPILALIGSDQPVSRAQVAAVEPSLRPSVITCDLPIGTDRERARVQIRDTFLDLLRRSERPGTLFISGGETLREICIALGASQLEVDGEIVPGVPTSILRGGSWEGQRIVSKSGAFGDTGFLARLLGETR